MSRETFALTLNLSPDQQVHVFTSHIIHMHYDKKEEKTIIQLSDGTELKVTQTPVAIFRMGEKYGVIRELTQ